MRSPASASWLALPAGCALWLVCSTARCDPPAVTALPSPSVGPASAPTVQAAPVQAVPAQAMPEKKPSVGRFFGGGAALIIAGIASTAGGIATLRSCGSSWNMLCPLGQAFAYSFVVSGVLHAIAGVTLVSVGGWRAAERGPTATTQGAPKPVVEVGISPGGASLLYRF